MRYKNSCKGLSTGANCVTLDFAVIMSSSDSPPGVMLPLWEHLAMLDGIFGCHNCRAATGI